MSNFRLMIKKNSFRFISKKKNHETDVLDTAPMEELAKNVKDFDKRAFLKVLGVAGVGLVATSLFPKKADALVMGSTPASNVVGVKDNSNNRINPAKEDGNLQTLTNKDFALESGGNLASIKTNTDKLKFDGDNLKVINTITGVNTTGIDDSMGIRINPSSEESILYLRRMVKLMESLAVVDTQTRQRVVVESAPSTAVTGTLTGVTTVATVTTVNQLAGVDSRWQIIDWARQAYNSGIRSNLINS